MFKTYIKLFKNDKKIEGDNQPLYNNSKVTIKRDKHDQHFGKPIILQPDELYSAAIWKNDDGSLNFKIEPKEEQLTPPTQQFEDI